VRNAVLASLAACLIAAAAVLANTSSVAHATASDSAPSANVALVPGFHAPKYSDKESLPGFPAGSLPGYHFGAVPLGSVTTANLSAYDTVVVYGTRWSDLSSSEQAAINAFAQTGKVIIWDADSTGAQKYSSFVHPFETVSSGPTGGSFGSVVTFPDGSPLASSQPSSPVYLDPAALVASTHLIGHMNAIVPSPTNWSPGLIASNGKIKDPSWVVAWGYGSTSDHSGMVIYSGIDADAFEDAASPNYAIRELSYQLAAPFNRAPDSSCAPNCGAPSGSGGGSGGTGGSGGSNGGGGNSSTFAQCSFTKKPPTGWQHGFFYLSLTTSVANGITGQVKSSAEKIIGTGTPSIPGHLALHVNSRLLPSNKVSTVKADVLVDSAVACSLTAQIRVDNVNPKAVGLKTTKTARGNMLTFRSNEPLRIWLSTPHHQYGTYSRKHSGRTTLKFPRSVTSGTLRLVDRAGNTTKIKVSWK
jgi:uncharacterized membrane protein YgcG